MFLRALVGIFGELSELFGIQFCSLLDAAGHRVFDGALARVFQHHEADIDRRDEAEGFYDSTDLLHHRVDSRFYQRRGPFLPKLGDFDFVGDGTATLEDARTNVHSFVRRIFETGKVEGVQEASVALVHGRDRAH